MIEKDHGAGIPERDPIEGRIPIFDLILQDIEDRKEFGLKKYGTTLQAFNGRDALWDAYQEALDLAVYLRQAITERDTKGE